MIFMYYTFRSENDHKSGNLPTYANKLAVSNVIELVNQNHLQVEAFKTIVNDAFERQFNLIQQLEDSDTDIHDVDPNEIFRCNFQENVTFLK